MMNDVEYAVIVEALPVNCWTPEELDGEPPVAAAALAAGAAGAAAGAPGAAAGAAGVGEAGAAAGMLAAASA